MVSLEVIAHLCAIATAAVAVYGYIHYRRSIALKRKRLEAYLRAEKAKGGDQGQRSLLHLMAKVGMTEAELLQASFDSNKIERKIAANKSTNRAEALLLEYVG